MTPHHLRPQNLQSPQAPQHQPPSWRRRWLLIVLLAVIFICMAAAIAWWLLQRTPKAYVQTTTLTDGSTLLIAHPQGEPATYSIIAATEAQHLNPNQLLQLARQTDAQLVQFILKPQGSCSDQQAQLQAAADVLDNPPDIVVGLDNGAALAYRWLAQQQDDDARALSIGFNVKQPDCSDQPLPAEAPHGHWEIIWNNDPESDTGLFVRQMQHTQTHTTIGQYMADSTLLLSTHLAAVLDDQQQGFPVVELPAPAGGPDGHYAPYADTVTLYYSGDGGWRDLDKVSGEYMAAHGYPVVGVDTLKLFWQHRSPERSAQDLAELMQTYRDKWGTKRFILAGYSFGADIMPALYNRLSAQDQASVGAIVLLAFSRSANFEIAVSGWLGQDADETLTGPEMQQLPADKVLCIYGSEEREDSGCLQPQAVGQAIEIPGDHHFDKNYEHLAQLIMQGIDKRMPPATITANTPRAAP